MNKIFVPTNRPEDWKPLLAEPKKHWRTGYSAKALAYSWEEADGFPGTVKKVFKKSGIALFKDVELPTGLSRIPSTFAGWSTPLTKRHFCLG